VVITYDSKLSADERLRISNAIVAAADLLNKNADKFTADEKKAIREIVVISTTNSPKAYLGMSGIGCMTLSLDYINRNSVAWIASVIGHEGQHSLNFGKYMGEERWRDEQSASRTQMGIGSKIGLSNNEKSSLQNWMNDKNRADMQNHMEYGYTH
jgi:hypothetical protein